MIYCIKNGGLKLDKKNLRYAILKLLEEKEDPFKVLVSEEIPESDVLEQGRFLHAEGYIRNNIYADNTIYFWGNLTEKGEEYLQENSKLAKAYSLAKEIRDWIPLMKN